MKKKIVSVDLPDIRDFKECIYISENYDDFVENLRTTSRKIISDDLISKNTWESRFNKIEEVLEEIADEG